MALGILYIHTARAQGWTAAGLNFPGHFLVRLESAGRRVIIDPFHGCRPRDTAALRGLLKAMAGNEAELAPEHYAATGNRQVLLRLQANIKLRLLRDRRPRDALEILESMIMIAPDGAALWREAGLLHAHLGNLRAALMALEHVMDLSRDPAERHETGADPAGSQGQAELTAGQAMPRAEPCHGEGRREVACEAATARL